MIETLHENRPTQTTRHPAQRTREILLHMSDEALMAQFQAGTVEAFNILYDRYADRLKRFLYSFSKNARLCEDLLQETFVRIYRNRHSYQRIAKFSTWLYTIAGNLARSEYRKAQRHKTLSLHTTNRDGEEYEIPLPTESFLPDDYTEGTLQVKYIHDALKKIRPAFREVVVLRDIQHLSYDEIAEITGLPMGTVKSRINRGRTQLKTLLMDIYPFMLAD